MKKVQKTLVTLAIVITACAVHVGVEPAIKC